MEDSLRDKLHRAGVKIRIIYWVGNLFIFCPKNRQNNLLGGQVELISINTIILVRNNTFLNENMLFVIYKIAFCLQLRVLTMSVRFYTVKNQKKRGFAMEIPTLISISLYTIFLRPYIFIFTFLNCVIVNSGKLFHVVHLLSHK